MAKHLQELFIEEFRGINNLKLANLSDFNFVLGTNNSGKTTILEAIQLLRAPDNFVNIVRVSRLRESHRFSMKFTISAFDAFICLFNKRSNEMKIKISALLNKQIVSLMLSGEIHKKIMDFEESIRLNQKLIISDSNLQKNDEIDVFLGELRCNAYLNELFDIVVPIEYSNYTILRPTPIKTIINMSFLSSIDHITNNTFSKIIRDKELKEEVVEMLKLFDPSIMDLRINQESNGKINQVVDSSLFNKYLPLSTYGDGIKKVIAVANSIYEAKDGIVLIDEIETAIHKSILKKFFEFVVKACKKNNVQLFATTHSIETVDALLKTQYNESKDIYDENNHDIIRIITLRKDGIKNNAIVLDGKNAFYERATIDMELRV